MSDDDGTLSDAQAIAQGTAVAEWILGKLVERRLNDPSDVLQLGLVLATLAHGGALERTNEGSARPAAAMRVALTPAGEARVRQLVDWFLESLRERFAEENPE